MGAIEFIRQQALARREAALALIRNVQQMSAIATPRLNHGLVNLGEFGRIAFHFHPDRLDSRGWPVVMGLLNDGVYRTQFETRLSNGKLSPQLGGNRDHWENQQFGDCYIGARNRPKYGSLDIGLHQSGPSARFGSCYLLSTPQLMEQCTFCYLDSCREPKERGTLACFEDVFAALFNESFERDTALGRYPMRPAALVEYLCEQLPDNVNERFARPMSGDLDHYIEAQYHGELRLERDISHLVADPCYRGSEIESLMQQLCQRYNLQLCWHQGYRMALADVPDDFRGAQMPALAARVANDGYFTAADIGVAAASVSKQPVNWREFGGQGEVMQQLKLLWHVLVRFGVSN
ncbi:hypothetical protein HR45_01285 [Shewanella mangrovi]|uniref:DUF3626 domain-containing protein n=1 Tax=Shewanella mangrovi TaxID=1515746 RepID=A0A094JGI5_9GAMM|nr:DUF3626 domain-containing protein [Shewanella mangrovi]KFZ39060.1 hypothetical protein HR45_01285 [Shewanella mangrovi]